MTSIQFADSEEVLLKSSEKINFDINYNRPIILCDTELSLYSLLLVYTILGNNKLTECDVKRLLSMNNTIPGF